MFILNCVDVDYFFGASTACWGPLVPPFLWFFERTEWCLRFSLCVWLLTASIRKYYRDKGYCSKIRLFLFFLAIKSQSTEVRELTISAGIIFSFLPTFEVYSWTSCYHRQPTLNSASNSELHSYLLLGFWKLELLDVWSQNRFRLG